MINNFKLQVNDCFNKTSEQNVLTDVLFNSLPYKTFSFTK